MKFFIALILIAFSNLCFSKDLIRIGVSISNPPYAIAEKNSGFQIELLNKIYEKSKYKIVFVYATNARLLIQFLDGDIDGILNANPDFVSREYKRPTFSSMTVATFRNHAITLKKNALRIETINDLRNLRINAFQNATSYLGDEFSTMAKMNKRYSEIPQQKNQPEYLLRDRADVIVADKHIFTYYLHLFNPKIKRDDVFEFHPIFSAEEKAVIFKNKQHQTDFDKNFSELIKTKYVEKLRRHYSFEY